MEIAIFFSQIFSMMIYLILCKVYVFLKKKICSHEQIQKMNEEDPFWRIIFKGNFDILTNQNQIMICTTLQITNILVGIFSSFYIFNNEI
jgi:hypothetical protein